MLPTSAALDFTLLLTSLSAGALASIILALEYCAGRNALARGWHQLVSRFLTPKVIWALVLVASLIGSRYLAAHLIGTLASQEQQHSVDLQDVPVLDRQAYTDKGRPISLFHFALHTSADEVEQFMQASETHQKQVIRLANANPATNCHGWVFLDGAYGLRDFEVHQILEDNGYTVVDSPREGDVAIYTTSGKINHSGLARRPDPHGPILVQSKWGPFGLYLHAPDKQPFGGLCTFYRSPRAGHAIQLVPTTSVSAAE
jgi:hypothetical protein